MMDSIPIVFVTFNVIVLVTGMFFAVKWHYEQGKKTKKAEKRAVLLGAAKAAAIFAISLLGLGLFTFVLAERLVWT